MPRNKELMRVFKDLDLVEHMGSGIPRILRSYGRNCFKFSENFLRITFPSAAPVTEQVTEQVISLLICFGQEAESSKELMNKLGIKHRQTFLYTYLQVALTLGLIEMDLPDKPNSRFQKYRLTPLGRKHHQELLNS